MATYSGDPAIRRMVIAAAGTLLAEDPTTPITRIAAEAGISRATFYRHFGSREDLRAAIPYDPPRDARARILDAAGEMLVRGSLARLSMDELARAAGVSRGTLYRIFPGKPALVRAMVEAYSPFEAIASVLARHYDDPPGVVLPLLGRAIVGAAEPRVALLRTVFHEATSGSDEVMAGLRDVLRPALGALASYVSAQMEAGHFRRMHPLVALQAILGPIHFHLMTRPLAGAVFGPPPVIEDAVDDLVEISLDSESHRPAIRRASAER